MTFSRITRTLVVLLSAVVATSGLVGTVGLEAFGFALLGAALISAAARFELGSAVFGSGAVLVGLTGLASQQVPGPTISILVLAGLALAFSRWSKRPMLRLVVALVGAIVALLGGLELLEGIYGAGIAGIASGIALLVGNAAAPRRPLAVGLVGLLVAALLWQGLAKREKTLVDTTIGMTLVAVENETRSELEARILALVRMAARWATEGMPSRRAFDLEASLSLLHFPGYQSIGWMDPDNVNRWVWPATGSGAEPGGPLGSEPQRSEAILAASAARAPRVTRPLELRPGAQGFMVFTPIGDPAQNGLLFGAFRARDLFDHILGGVAQDYGIRLALAGETIYERSGDATPPRETSFLLGGHTWNLTLYPPRTIVAGSILPQAMFGAAALLSVLLAVAAHFALVARSLAGRLEERVDLAVQEREQAETQLRQAQKMESIGQLTGGIAHDFNNMLTVISGNLELLTSKLAGQPRLLRLAESAAAAAERGERLTAQLLAFSRRQQLDPQPLDLNEAISEMEDLLDRTVGDRVALSLSLAPDLRPSMVDRNQVEAALLNLVLNARAATPDTGTIEVRTANAKEGFVELSVADTGKGMSEAVRARAFEPFFTTKERGKGTGLGLSMVYGFARQSGGEAYIESAEGVGTVVRLLLPVATEVGPRREEAIPPTARGRGETVLCVEDQEDVLAFAVETLQGLGYNVLTAGDADAALSTLERRDVAVDLLFTDVMMPGTMDGAELARLVRSRWPTLPVVLTSGYAERQVARESRFPFLRKPYRAATLAVAIRSALQQREPSSAGSFAP